MKKVVKFGGSSLASAEQFKKVGKIIRADESRKFVVPSAPGKRFSNDIKVTDMLYSCYGAAIREKKFVNQLDDIHARYQEIIDGLNREIEEYYAKKVPLKEGVRSFLEGFRELHIPMVIATTGDRKNLEEALKRLGIRNLFEGILTCTEMQTDKSKPDIYLAAALQMDCDPDEVIVFEDAYHAIVTAKKAGFITVGVYDQANDRDLAKIWNTADVYLPGYDDFQKFWWSMTEKGEDEV